MLATFHAPFWATMPSLGEVSLGERLGWVPAVMLQLLAFGLIAGAIRHADRRRHRARVGRRDAGPGWERWLRWPWPLLAGSVALAGLNALTVLLAGHPWTITWAFTIWGGKVLVALGYDLTTVPFWTGEFQQAALAAPVLADVTSVMDIGLIIGALLGAGLAGRFAPGWRIAPSVVMPSLVGGLLLGYGARIAFGCNIGALVSGIASTSLHGWLWAAGAVVGTPLGVQLRGRIASVGPEATAPACGPPPGRF